MDNKNKDKNVSSLYGELCRYEQLGEYERAIKVCNKILQIIPDDVHAFTAKAICMMLMGQFEEVIKLTKKYQNLSKGLQFEISYCLYRLNRASEANKYIQNAEATDDKHRVEELKSQISYKMDNFFDAVERYSHVFKDFPDDEYEAERQTNICAAASFLPDNNQLEEHLSKDNYEVCFNKALKHARLNNIAECEGQLKKCESLMRESLEEDGATEEEIMSEFANIKALQAYCLQIRGHSDEAHKIYLDLLKNKHEDPSLNIVASNNIAVINKDQNVFDSKKKLKLATNDAALQKMPSEQKQYILLNNAIFNYITNQFDQAYKLSINIQKTMPGLLMQASTLAIMSSSKLNAKIDPIDELLKYDSKTEEDELMVKLTCVHILLSQGNKGKACEILEGLGNFRYKPAIVGALITLYLNQGKEDVAQKVYEESIEWYKRNENVDVDLTGFFTQAATFHIRSGRPEVAAQSLEQLLSCTTDPDPKTVAQLVTAYAQFDEDKAIALESKLGPISDLEAEVDMDNLESSSWLTKKPTALTTPKESSPGTPVNVQKRKKRNKKRRGKLPKDYDASAVPDPERWLPKYERTGFRKKRDRRMKDIIKGSQGTASGQSDQFDYSKVAVEDESPTVEPSPVQKGGARQKRPVQKKRTNKRR